MKEELRPKEQKGYVRRKMKDTSSVRKESEEGMVPCIIDFFYVKILDFCLGCIFTSKRTFFNRITTKLRTKNLSIIK